MSHFPSIVTPTRGRLAPGPSCSRTMTIPDCCAYHLPGEIDEFCSPFCSYELVLRMGAEQNSNPTLAQELQRLLGRSSSNTPSNIGSFRSAGGDSSGGPSETLLIEFLASFESSSDFSRLISITNDYGQTLAHLAVPFRCSALLGALIKWGSDISVPDANGFTPLDFAYLYKAQECIDTLLVAGASSAMVDAKGQTPRELGMIDSKTDHGNEVITLDRKEDVSPRLDIQPGVDGESDQNTSKSHESASVTSKNDSPVELANPTSASYTPPLIHKPIASQNLPPLYQSRRLSDRDSLSSLDHHNSQKGENATNAYTPRDINFIPAAALYPPPAKQPSSLVSYAPPLPGGPPLQGRYVGFSSPAAYGTPPGADPQLWQWFRAVDEDRSGSISCQELQRALVNGNWARTRYRFLDSKHTP